MGQLNAYPPQQHEQQNKNAASKPAIANNDKIGTEENRATCSDADKRDECAVALRGAIASERQADYAKYALWGVGLTIAFSAFASWAAWQALRAARKQAQAALDQVAIMRRDQRPWVVVDSMTATGEAMVQPGEVTIPVHLHLENFGTKIATEVRAKFYPYFAGAWDPILMEPERILMTITPQTSDQASIFLAPGRTDKIYHVLRFEWNGIERLFDYAVILAVVSFDDGNATHEFGCGFTVSRRALYDRSRKPPKIDRAITIKHWSK